MRIVCFGDSLTAGYGVYPSQRWVVQLGHKLKCEILNKGINGDTTAGMLCRSFQDVINSEPTHVIIMGGTNDLLQGYKLDNVIENIKELIMESIGNNIRPVIGIQIPMEEDMAERYWCDGINYKKINDNIEIYRKWVMDYSKVQSIKYIDFYGEYTRQLKIMSKSELYIEGVHPTALGHEIMYSCAAKVFL